MTEQGVEHKGVLILRKFNIAQKALWERERKECKIYKIKDFEIPQFWQDTAATIAGAYMGFK